MQSFNSMSDAQTILQALKKTIIGSSTQQIKNAQQILQSYQTKQDFINNIQLILQSNNIDRNLQKAAAIYLNKHAKNIFKMRNQQLLLYTAEKILKLLMNFKINHYHKTHICRALEYLLISDKTKTLRSKLQPNIISLLNLADQQTDDQINFEFLVFFAQILMSNPGLTEEVEKYINKTFEPFLKISLRVLNLLEQALQAKSSQIAAKLMFLYRQYIIVLKLYLKRFLFIDIEMSKLLYKPQLVTLIIKSLQLKLQNNLLSYSIFHLTNNPSHEQKIFNDIKTNIISFLNNFIRTILSHVKQPKLLQLNLLYKKTQQILPIFIKSSQQLMKNHGPYYKIKDLSVLGTLDIVYSFYITTIRANSFYHVFVQLKDRMIQDLIFRALIFTPQDYQNYYEEPQQFLNTIMQIVQRDLKLKVNQEAEENQIQTFNTLRTNAAQFLNTFCKYQDGTLTQIMQYAFLILQGKLNSQFSPNLMLLIITILKDISKQRRDLHTIIGNLVMKLLNEMQPPKKNTQQPESKNNKEIDIQYSMTFLLMSQYYSKIQMVNPKIVQYSFKLCHKILNDVKVQEVPKLISFEILEVINRLEEGQQYAPQILKTFNYIIEQQSKPSQKLLQAYFTLVKYNDIILKQKCYPELCQTIQIIAAFIHKQINTANRQQIIINKLWNVIRQIGENPQFIPLMIEPIENIILPLLPYVDTNSQLDFQEDILMLMSAFIGKSKQVTHNQLKIFQIIPKIFYNNYKGVFGHAFQTIQVFIYHGKQILKSAPIAIQSIVQMSLTSISHKDYKGKKLSQADNCQGVLILQSLIIACGFSININLYENIADVVTKRLNQNIKFDFFKSNLCALLALVLIHNCQSFQPQINQHLLSTILNNLKHFQKIKHSTKMLIFSLNKLILINQYDFVKNRFTQILDTIITLLQCTALRKQNMFQDDEEDQQRDYSNSLLQTMNQIIKLDQFQDFKTQITTLKEKSLSLIQSSVNQLPQSKKDYLKHVLRVQRVGNEPRKIFSIKRNQ